MALFQRVCELDLEGIVAKEKSACYVTEREHSTWCKLLNREYSQRDAREELFERERHSEPVAGWHLCDFRRSVSDRDNGSSGGESGGYCGTSTISAFNHVTLMSRHCSPLSNARIFVWSWGILKGRTCSRTDLTVSPQGVLHFRTVGSCSSERRFRANLRPGHPKVKRKTEVVLEAKR